MGFLSSLGQIGSSVSPIIGGLSAISGLISDGSARAAAARRQQEAMQAYGSAMDQQYQNQLGRNQQTLMGAAGQGGTAIANLGSNMGSALAGAGVYNSSAVGGALAQAQANTNQSLTDLAARNQYGANQLFNQGQAGLAQMRLGQANTDYGNASADLQGSRQGLGQFISALGQSNLQKQQGQQEQPQQLGYDPTYVEGELRANGIGDGNLYTRQASGIPPIDSSGNLYGSTNGGPLGASGIGSLGQSNLGNSGANALRMHIPQTFGTQSQAPNLWGNAGGLGNGGQGAGGSNPFYTPEAFNHPFSYAASRNPNNGPLGGR
jgi:hypothetical protein